MVEDTLVDPASAVNPSRRPTIKATLVAIVFLLVVTLIHFRVPLMGKGAFYRVDLADTYLPLYVENARLRAEGEFPLWNTHAFLGYPTQAETEVSGVYPPGVIFNFIGDASRAYTLFIIFHFFVAAIGMMYLLRVLGAKLLGQTCAALVFVYGGTFVDYVVTLTFITTLAWTPAILGMQLRSFKRRSFRHAFVAGLLLGVQASGANPTAGIHQVLLMCGVVLLEARGPFRWQRLKFAIQSTAITVVVGACLSAPQLLYFADYIWHSERWKGSQQQQPYGSLPPMLLLQTIVPEAWLRWTKVMRITNEYRIYFGILSISLIAIGCCAKTRFVPAIRVVFFLCILLALGIYGGLWSLVSRMPLLVNLHVPWRFLVLASMAGAALAGIGLDQVLHHVSRLKCKKKLLINCHLVLTIVLTCATLFVWYAQPPLDGLTAVDGNALARCLLIASVFAALSAVFWILFGSNVEPEMIGMFAIGIITIDLLVCGNSAHMFAPADYYSKVPSTVSYLRKDTQQWRVFRIFDSQEDIDNPVPGHFPQNMAALYDIDAYNANAASPLLDVAAIWHKRFWRPPLTLKELGLFNVKYFVLTEPAMMYVPGTKDVAPHEYFPDLKCRLFVNPYWQPRISLRTRYTVIQGFENVRYFVNSDKFSLSESVTLDEDPQFVPGLSVDAQSRNPPVQLLHYGAHRVALNVETSQDAILVLSDYHHPGWHATINGNRAKILRANGIVRGLALGAGRHHVEFTYRPRSFYSGLYLMGAMSIFLVGYCVHLARSSFKSSFG